MLVILAPTAHAQDIALDDVSSAVAAEIGAIPPAAGDGLQGVAWLDFDQDDDLDLFHTNGPGLPARLFRNDRDGRFTEVAAAAGVAVTTGNAGVLAADLDGDGLTDLMLLGDGCFYRPTPSPAYLLQNRGDGTFEDVTEATGLRTLLPPTYTFAVAGDADQDGDLDVFVGAPGSLVHRRQDDNVLLRNDGGRFTDITADAGLLPGHGACAAAFLRMDDDDALDLVVANCSEVHYYPNPLQLFLNQGQGRFLDVHIPGKIWATGWFMAVAAGDVDGDQRLDLFSTNEGAARDAPNVLYVARADGTYAETATPAGLAGFDFGWGATVADLDNDGAQDLYYAGSPVLPVRLEMSSPGYALRNDGSGTTFTLEPQPFDLSTTPTGGLAAADYDDDGRVDLAIASGRHVDTQAWSSPILLHNVNDSGAGWVTVRLRGELPNADGVGARIRAELRDGTVQRRDVIAGSSFLSTESPWPTFGLGPEADEVRLAVTWPDGTVEDYGWVPSDRRVDLVRGAGIVPESPAPPLPAGCGCRTGSGPAGFLWLVALVARRRRHRPSDPNQITRSWTSSVPCGAAPVDGSRYARKSTSSDSS